ncbi:TPA: KilA-N domain-containing protein [Proteus mirabilis]|uniref:KilA-N domain-containing protein n=1 Tax=Proteus mirabilis TaxID=584 RepID=A0AAN4CA99_PROMI|nr:KilA-N domain-containing protein [Proteus mirabilis]EMD1500802.1 KilA-N domain-containing protein [Proteus mirabilis]HEK0520610.1 KilA-N domain-containing protein [Proteus mirabilis]HEK1779968.1 KilA-N domain-containing protein [Proteus mirabilis]HEK2007056.1 KilA-N domain-containing protein [Proteus mirabilis]
MIKIVPMKYDETLIPFNGDCWVNATVAAKIFDKRTLDWLRLDSTKEYAKEIGQELDIEAINSKGEISHLLVKVEKGRYGGTWIHPELVIEFARWLSPKFARACDRHIKNMLMSQNMTLTEDQVIGLLTYKEATEWEKRFQEPYYRALSKMSGTPYFGHVGGCPLLFAGITAKWVYGVALPDYVYESVKENKGDREKIHQYLKGDALLAVEKQMVAVTNIANSSVDYKDFDARCMAAFDVKGQMQLLYPSSNQPSHTATLQ